MTLPAILFNELRYEPSPEEAAAAERQRLAVQLMECEAIRGHALLERVEDDRCLFVTHWTKPSGERRDFMLVMDSVGLDAMRELKTGIWPAVMEAIAKDASGYA